MTSTRPHLPPQSAASVQANIEHYHSLIQAQDIRLTELHNELMFWLAVQAEHTAPKE
jgi:hypothetical protein